MRFEGFVPFVDNFTHRFVTQSIALTSFDIAQSAVAPPNAKNKSNVVGARVDDNPSSPASPSRVRFRWT